MEALVVKGKEYREQESQIIALKVCFFFNTLSVCTQLTIMMSPSPQSPIRVAKSVMPNQAHYVLLLVLFLEPILCQILTLKLTYSNVIYGFLPKCAEFRHPELLSEESLSWKQKKKKKRGCLPSSVFGESNSLPGRRTASTDVTSTSVCRPSSEDNKIIIELL